MALTIAWPIIDCHDLGRMSAFWQEALDFEHVLTGPSGGYLLAAKDGLPGRLGLIPTPDEKTGKNRVHLDLRPDRDQDAEVRRLESLGATQVDVGQHGATWVVMADPEGNEFCVLRPLRPSE